MVRHNGLWQFASITVTWCWLSLVSNGYLSNLIVFFWAKIEEMYYMDLTWPVNKLAVNFENNLICLWLYMVSKLIRYYKKKDSISLFVVSNCFLLEHCRLGLVGRWTIYGKSLSFYERKSWPHLLTTPSLQGLSSELNVLSQV